MSLEAVRPRAVTADASAMDPAPGWLVSPWFDLLLIANVAWPLFFLAQLGEGFEGRDGIRFWQIYYVSTPHRWITLLLVFLDRERFQARRGVFLGVAAAIALVCVGVRLSTGALTCLLAIDYLWNAWHFAAQHHGIYRIYTRNAVPRPSVGLALEKWGMRLFLLYVIVRIATATWPSTTYTSSLKTIDWFAALIPAALVARHVILWRGQNLGGTCYLLSVSGLYLSALGAAHVGRPVLVLSLATASALFHAIEYLALVAWSVRRRHAAVGERMGLLGYLAPRWGITVGAFIMILGVAGWLMDQGLLQTWLFINLIVSFWHYAYDGLIWRQRPSPATATAQ